MIPFNDHLLWRFFLAVFFYDTALRFFSTPRAMRETGVSWPT
jgi:hypothetical protein